VRWVVAVAVAIAGVAAAVLVVDVARHAARAKGHVEGEGRRQQTISCHVSGGRRRKHVPAGQCQCALQDRSGHSAAAA